MVTPEDIVSIGGQHALRDMVELQMYLVTQAQQSPWCMLPRRSKKERGEREPNTSLVAWGVAKELVDRGYIESTSNRTFVVSKTGYQYYEQQIK